MSVELFRGKWRYRKRIVLPDGIKKDISGTPDVNTKGAAEAAELNHILRLTRPELVQAAVVEAKKASPTFEAWSKQFLELSAANNKPSEIMSKKSILSKHLSACFSGKDMDEIDYASIQSYVAEKKASGLSNKTIHNHQIVLRRMLMMARKMGYIKQMPELEMVKVIKPSIDFLTVDEATSLLNAATGQYRLMILIAWRCGLRQGEILALRWTDIDLTNKTIHVQQSYTKGHFTAPKGNKSRIIPLGEDIATALQNHKKTGEFVFCHDNASHLKHWHARYPLRHACRKAGIREIGWHILRHTFASHLVMKGVPLKAVQELLGHQSIQITERYAHLSPHISREAVKLLDDKSVVSVSYSGPTNDLTT